MSMGTLDTRDHTFGTNLGGTWVQLDLIAEELGMPVENVENIFENTTKRYDWLSEEIVDFTYDKIKDIVQDELGLNKGQQS